MEQVNGNHHLTMSVGPAQEDYDFHTRTLGMRSIKKTVLFDGRAPIYHLYYGNADGTPSSVLTTFPFRQAGVMGRRGTNQVKVIDLAVPKGSLGFWEGRLADHGIAAERGTLLGTERLSFAHPSGIPYALIEVEGDTRAGHTGGGVGADAAIHGSYGVTVSIHMADEMTEFLELGMQGRRVASEGSSELWQLGDGPGNVVELVEEPDVPRGTWRFGEGTVHHVAFDAGSLEAQMELKLHIEGLGYTDVSDVKDRQYFNSCYVRTPGGPLFELAVSKPEAWAIDEPADALGTDFMLPPWLEDRRAELMGRLEPIDTAGT
ncbi:MAG: Glyoxalase family protein [uncultured Solirubrobacteraceae bacterium]|uniref:Glyoxalase family protein n=1 Tax=uncultured Solirubrobacteraceae bacterium TaxID=1162706 RepID=A0A6J4SQB5_9ACTN|nr:MAG: Glyoxalase family protein [uncultured Solirubrobacteraceae bacterium]